MNYVLDTSFVSSLINDQDSNYVLARETLSSIDYDSRLILPAIVIAELLSGAEDTDKSMKYFAELAHKVDFIEERHIDFLLDLDKTTRRTLKANDCLVMASCALNKAELVTFDKRLQKVWKRLN